MQCTSQDTPCRNRDGRVYHVKSNECSSLLVPLSISFSFCESVLLGGLFIVPEPGLFISLSLAGILERETWHAIFGSGGVVIRRVQSVHLKFCFPRVRLVLIDAEYQDYAVEL
jgi:hypothetical protein